MRVLLCAMVIVVLQDDVRKLIDDLNSREIEKRDAAEKKLLALGEKAEQPLEHALATTDVEARGRIQKVLDVLRRKAVFKGLLAGRQKHEGGSKETEESVRLALGWLARHQGKDGAWNATTYVGSCKGGKCAPNPGQEDYTVALTGLALAAFLGAGHTEFSKEKEGDLLFGDVVKAGLEFLVKRQNRAGFFEQTDPKYLYHQAWGTVAMVEAAAMTQGGKPWQESAERAVAAIQNAQNPKKGWRYSIQCGDSDTSVTMTCLQALVVAKSAGIDVADASIAGARAWFDEVTDGFGRVGYTFKGTGKVFVPGMNEQFEHHEALAMGAAFGRVMSGSTVDEAPIEAARSFAAQDLPTYEENKIDCYYWHWATEALHQIEGPKGKTWKTWSESLQAALCDNQNRKECKAGSWEPIDRWSGEGGRVYVTAINALTLETPYRYARAAK